MDQAKILSGLDTETSGREMLEEILSEINSWFEDEKIDASEMRQASEIEKSLRGLIDAKLLPEVSEEGLEKYPGWSFVIGAWLRIASFLTMAGVKTDPVEVSNEVT